MSRRGLGAWAAGMASLGGVPRAARGETLAASAIRDTLLPCGMRLVVKEAHATRLAALQLWMRAGSLYEDDANRGAAHVLEHLLFKGETTGGEGSLDWEIENLGGLLEAITDRDWTSFRCALPGRFVPKALAFIAEALRKPRLRPEDLESERPVLKAEIDRIALEPFTTAELALHELAYERHPYRHDVRGTPAFVDRVEIDALRAYFRAHYHPARWTLVVAGDVDAGEMEALSRRLFPAAAAAPAEPKPPDEEEACRTARRRVVRSPFVNSYVALAYPAPSVRDIPDVHAMDLLLTMLEHEGAGRLPLALAGKGVVVANFETRRHKGLLTVTASAAPGTEEATETLLRREVDFLATRPIPPDELQTAKRILRGSYALQNETLAGQAGTLGVYAAIDRWQFASDYLARVEAVTPEQARQTAGRYLRADRTVAAVLQGTPEGPR